MADNITKTEKKRKNKTLLFTPEIQKNSISFPSVNNAELLTSGGEIGAV
jgi:hypothetical protein